MMARLNKTPWWMANWLEEWCFAWDYQGIPWGKSGLARGQYLYKKKIAPSLSTYTRMSVDFVFASTAPDKATNNKGSGSPYRGDWLPSTGVFLQAGGEALSTCRAHIYQLLRGWLVTAQPGKVFRGSGTLFVMGLLGGRVLCCLVIKTQVIRKPHFAFLATLELCDLIFSQVHSFWLRSWQTRILIL